MLIKKNALQKDTFYQSVSVPVDNGIMIFYFSVSLPNGLVLYWYNDIFYKKSLSLFPNARWKGLTGVCNFFWVQFFVGMQVLQLNEKHCVRKTIFTLRVNLRVITELFRLFQKPNNWLFFIWEINNFLLLNNCFSAIGLTSVDCRTSPIRIAFMNNAFICFYWDNHCKFLLINFINLYFRDVSYLYYEL